MFFRFCFVFTISKLRDQEPQNLKLGLHGFCFSL